MAINVVRYQPWSSLGQLQNDLGRMLSRTLGTEEDQSTVETSQWMPLVDIKEEPGRFVLLADVPGVDPKNIEVSMEGGVLTVKGERTAESKEERDNFTRIERTKGVFYRRFTLPDTADAENITAHGKHGVLEVIIPKREKAKSRKIEVMSKDK